MRIGNESVFNTLGGERSEKADQMHRVFIELGVNFATGVPCGVLRHIIRNFNDDGRILHINSQEELKRAIMFFMQGPGFILAKIDLGGRRDFLRPSNLVEIKDRFMRFLNQNTT